MWWPCLLKECAWTAEAGAIVFKHWHHSLCWTTDGLGAHSEGFYRSQQKALYTKSISESNEVGRLTYWTRCPSRVRSALLEQPSGLFTSLGHAPVCETFITHTHSRTHTRTHTHAHARTRTHMHNALEAYPLICFACGSFFICQVLLR